MTNNLPRTLLSVLIVFVDREVVPTVLVIGERRITQSESAAKHGFVGQPVGDAQSRREILVVGLHAHVLGVAADARHHQAVGIRVIVGEPGHRMG